MLFNINQWNNPDNPKAHITTTGPEIMEQTNGEVDAVIIATPHYDHTIIGIDALEQGLHVLVEKPISVHKNDAKKLIAAHTNKDQVFAAMFNQRTDPKFKRVKKLNLHSTQKAA